MNTTALQVKNVDIGDFCVKLYVKSKCDGFEWVLVSVYGAAQDEHKPMFLLELVRLCENEPLPMLVGGDFKILQKPEEKSNVSYNPRWPIMFNAIIQSLKLREIDLNRRKYTWANRTEVPTYEKLDRILATIEWEQKFSLVMVQAPTRTGLDHTPLFVDSGVQAHLGNKACFSFELSWLQTKGFYEMVAAEWAAIVKGNSSIEVW